MALKANMSSAQVLSEVDKQADALYDRILNAFIYAGEEFVINARSQMQDHAMGTYKDVTTNLRNSIGYFVYLNGELVRENLIGNIEENKQEIKEYIKDQSIQLIGIAGMNYASYVEAKGYNVISYQGDLCVLSLLEFMGDLDLVKKEAAARFEQTFIPEDLPENFIVAD